MNNSANNNVSLRAPEPSDIDFLYRLENLPELWRVSLTTAHVTRHLLYTYLSEYSADPVRDGQLRLIIVNNGTSVGTVDLSDYDPVCGRAMVGIAIDTPYRRHGFARQALQQLIDLCTEHWGLQQLCAMVPVDNLPSLRLFTSLGFTHSGTLHRWLRRRGSYTDVMILQLLF